MKHLRILALAATAVLGGATAASAQEAFTTNDVNMRAGPGGRFPVVTTIPEDSNVYVHGCLANFDWCDVSWRRIRGWVISDYLEAMYHNRRLGFDEWRNYYDIPTVTFGFGYWDRYYRDRPWFDEWDRWGGSWGGSYGGHDRWRHHRDNNNDWNNNDNSGSDWNRNRDHNYSNDYNNNTWDNQSGDNNNDGTDRTVRRRYIPQQDTNTGRPGRRCGTADADPSCPDTAHGMRQ